ncbi:MAG: YceI family protein [Kiloniellales bacterium]|nr:YceI family protein [Kiloniellales bacterium]
MNRLIASFAAVALLTTAGAPQAAEAPLWSVEPESSVGFVARQAGAPVEGRFERFAAEVRFDAEDLEASRVAVVIEVASVNSESSDRDGVIRSKDLFDVETWPEARFEAARFEHAGGDVYEAHGSLTMRDVTLDVVLPFDLKVENDPDDPALLRARAQGELSVMRLDYGVGQGQWRDTSVVADEVVIRIDITATRPKG